MARTGRPREFDVERALARAMDLFWARGYGETSIQDLVDALGVERGSLYAAFGDKRRFYLEAVKLYWAEYERRLISGLAAGPVLPALREVLATPAQLEVFATDLGVPQGCMVGNTTAELVPHDGEAKEIVAQCNARFVEIVAEALRRGQADGEIVATSSPEIQARMLLFLTQGLSLVSRAGADVPTSLAAIDAAIDGLRATHTPAPAARRQVAVRP